MDIQKIGILVVTAVLIGAVAFVALNTEKPVLTIEYNGEKEEFTLDDLKELEKTTITTYDPHLKKEIQYEGVSLVTIKEVLRTECSSVKVIAKDGYNTAIDAEDFDMGIIIAYKADGEHISQGKGGPIKLSFSEEAKKIYDENNWVWWITRLIFQ